jgi:hypothetical protein
MKVKIIKNVVGPLGSFKKGRICDVPNNVATELLNCGFATKVEEGIEKAVANDIKETATKTTKTSKRRTSKAK